MPTNKQIEAAIKAYRRAAGGGIDPKLKPLIAALEAAEQAAWLLYPDNMPMLYEPLQISNPCLIYYESGGKVFIDIGYLNLEKNQWVDGHKNLINDVGKFCEITLPLPTPPKE